MARNYYSKLKNNWSEFKTTQQLTLKKQVSKLNNFKDLITENINNRLNKKIKKISENCIGHSTRNLSDLVQEKIENTFETSIKDLALKQSSSWVKLITGGLLGGTIFGVAWLSIAKTEEIIIVQGKLEPFGGVVDVQIPIQGVVNNILIKEGQLVEKDDILVQLDTEISKSRESYLQKNLLINQDILNKLKVLSDEGAISKIQYLEQQAKVSQIKNSITENSVNLRYQNIKSPIKGFVFDLKPQKSGYVAMGGEPIMQIVPKNKLQAKVEIDSQKIGFINIGQKADISIDSYPATDFGVIEGEVTRIGSDALAPEPSLNKGFRFPADIKINNQYLTLKNGKKLSLQTGMSLTANVKLRKVSYLQLLLGTFRDKADSLREI